MMTFFSLGIQPVAYVGQAFLPVHISLSLIIIRKRNAEDFPYSFFISHLSSVVTGSLSANLRFASNGKLELKDDKWKIFPVSPAEKVSNMDRQECLSCAN